MSICDLLDLIYKAVKTLKAFIKCAEYFENKAKNKRRPPDKE